MVNNRIQIAEALETITENVKMTRPEGDVSFPLITYAEITNVNVGIRQDRIEYQIDGHTNTLPELLVLMAQIDEVMTDMGWHRTYITPDTQARQSKDFYRKSANYTARIDTLTNTITGGY